MQLGQSGKSTSRDTAISGTPLRGTVLIANYYSPWQIYTATDESEVIADRSNRTNLEKAVLSILVVDRVVQNKIRI